MSTYVNVNPNAAIFTRPTSKIEVKKVQELMEQTEEPVPPTVRYNYSKDGSAT